MAVLSQLPENHLKCPADLFDISPITNKSHIPIDTCAYIHEHRVSKLEERSMEWWEEASQTDFDRF